MVEATLPVLTSTTNRTNAHNFVYNIVCWRKWCMLPNFLVKNIWRSKRKEWSTIHLPKVTLVHSFHDLYDRSLIRIKLIPKLDVFKKEMLSANQDEQTKPRLILPGASLTQNRNQKLMNKSWALQNQFGHPKRKGWEEGLKRLSPATKNFIHNQSCM
jgi:hypothetical protein